MKAYRWTTLILVLIVIASMVTACAAPPEKELDPEMTNQLQAVLDDAVESSETQFPGALLYVNSPDLGTWSGARRFG